jgi:glycine hydroxymethyltransferase
LDGYQIRDQVVSLLKEHHSWFSRSLPLIASENVTSHAVREALISDFMHRYAEGDPFTRVYAGCRYLDKCEIICIELMKEIFRAEYADVRPVSGVVANLTMYTALTEPKDVMLALSPTTGGHISMAKKRLGGTAGAVHGLEVEWLPFDEKEMNVDVEQTRKKIAETKPKLVLFGGSVILFPYPVRELSQFAKDHGAHVGYDAAHVAGLIACGYFQDPLREGAEVMTMSTHKTLPGPQKGALVARKELSESLSKAAFPGCVSNHHLHNVAGLAIALAELKQFGREYEGQIIKNAKALGQALHERGMTVLAEHRGFTESHQILVDVTKFGDGGTLEKKLEEAAIIVNRNLLPWDIRMGRHYTNPGGLRLGTPELTRLGMKESHMSEVADFIKRIVVDNEDPKKVSADVAEFRKDFQKIRYGFESAREAYEYVPIA